MNKRGVYIISIITFLCSLIFSMGINFVFRKDCKKTGYVKLIEIYDQFELKNELSQKLIGTESARKKILDSMEFELKALQLRIEKNNTDKANLGKFELGKESYLYKKEEFESANQELSNSYNTQIWNQINQYVIDYGKENGYNYIFGTDGSGSIMYGEENMDITKEVVAYINNKYKGK